MKKTAIITGSSSGIGKHIAIGLSKQEYHVILISRNKKNLDKVKKEIEKNGNSCELIISDISKDSSFLDCAKKIKKIKNIHLLVNNAGIGIFNNLEDTSSKEWDIQLNTNLRGAFLITKCVLPSMIKKKTGKIVFINSVAGLNPYPYSSAYVASKYGLRGFSSALREEVREHNVKVISIYPGAVATPFWNNTKSDFPKDQMLPSSDVASSVINAILAPGNLVQEEIIIRRVAGDF